ncbi:hypothetical protein HMPREF1554_01344 [Porphyromonas gingivalis F0569]|nr:hypothetical protein HMPREF1554_01344 [Porphyromonas gingivalis F0569]
MVERPSTAFLFLLFSLSSYEIFASTNESRGVCLWNHYICSEKIKTITNK